MKRSFVIVNLLIIALKCTGESPYDLLSEKAFSRYLPERLKALITYVKQQGIDQACNFVLDDDDLDSYLFILDVQKPYILRCYSRQLQFCNKTAHELQNMMARDDEKQLVRVPLIFDQLVSTAQKGDTYLSYQWCLNKSSRVKQQVAYVHMITCEHKNYVLGAAFFTDYVPLWFIAEHRVKMIARRIKKEGLESVLPLLAHDPDPYMYFYVRQQHYPYRSIVNGSSDEFNLKTPEQMQQIVYPGCTIDEICNLELRYRNFEDITQHGGGFYAYLWPVKKKLQLKVGYIFPVEYKKTHYIVASGFQLMHPPKNLEQNLMDRTNSMIKLINEIGLDNAISVAHADKDTTLPVFIDEFDVPYIARLNVDRALEGKSAPEMQQIISKQCKGNVCPSVLNASTQIRFVTQKGGGFCVYLWQSGDTAHHTFLKIAYVKQIMYHEQSYIVGCGYLAT